MTTHQLDKKSMILLTGAAGFIGSCMAKFLNEQGYQNLLLVDEFNRNNKEANITSLKYLEKIDRNELKNFFTLNPTIDFVIHFGARTDTTEMDYHIHEVLNLEYSKMVWNYCVQEQIPLIYASSAATYGNGEFGYDDDHELAKKLQPLNPYGVSKNEFDKWALDSVRENSSNEPPHWYGLKFFNVYGPNEYHKGRMASVILHAFRQIQEQGKLKLFKSHRPDFINGGQMRDFIYVKDILAVTFWLMNHLPKSGLYNLGTGKAASFNELAAAIFSSMAKKAVIDFIDTPIDIRDKYQYFTEANMHKLREAGYDKHFYSISEGVTDYIGNYLIKDRFY